MVVKYGVVLIPAICTILVVVLKIVKWRIQSFIKHRKYTMLSNDPNIDLSVIIPAYNEAKRLPKMLDETIDYLEKRHLNPEMFEENPYRRRKFTYEIIIVDDGSTDKTALVALRYNKDYGKKVKLIVLEKNCGKGGAVRQGVLASRGSYLIFADADGASKFSDIEKLEKFMLDNKSSDLVCAIGSRAHMEAEATATRSLFRTILMKGFHFLVWICSVRTVRDTQCGFKMFNRNSAKILFTSYHNESWAFDVELLYLAEQIKCTIGEIAINWQEIEGSKIVPIFSWLRMGYDVMFMATLYTLGILQVPKVDNKSV